MIKIVKWVKKNPVPPNPLFSDPLPKVVTCFPSFSIQVPMVSLFAIWSQGKVERLVIKLSLNSDQNLKLKFLGIERKSSLYWKSLTSHLSCVLSSTLTTYLVQNINKQGDCNWHYYLFDDKVSYSVNSLLCSGGPWISSN